MRNFFILTHDSRDDLQSVSDYEIDGTDLTVFWTGQPYLDKIPDSVKLFVSDGVVSDYLGNPISWAIVSDRFLALLQEFAPKDFQAFPAPLFKEKRRDPLTGYTIVNVTRCVDALAGPLVTVDTLVLKADSIPLDAHLFRIIGHETLLFVSQNLFHHLCGNHLQGVAFIKTKCV